ncbi:CorA family divalent cation transporter [Peptacetobacter sp. AB845]|uniref:magnesium transporter CorA family protein n=1 Tax=Peptacetobacter sp. AB845 TaxID=3388429 RepID=UPI0039C94CD8
MKILELQSNRILEKFGDSYNLQNDYVILSKFDEVCEVKDILGINEDSFVDCMSFDNSIRINPNKSFDSMVLRSLEYIDDEIREFEAHIYTADNFILTVADDGSFIYKFMKNLILNRAKSEKSTRYVLYKINQYIIREYIMNGFEFVEMLEERILDIEDDMMENTNSSHIEEINKIRAIARKVVKNIRPLIYITDNAVSKDVRFLKEVELEEYNDMQGIDFGIDKLYEFSIATRDLADKLLDIYSSKINEKTNSLITKLTILTAIAAPLTIITGVYGMNFKYMPELGMAYGYPITIGIMLLIILIGIHLFKKNGML